MRRQIREIRVFDIVTHAVIPPILAAALWTVGIFLIYPKISHGWVLILVLSLISYFLLKRFLIGLVLLYKAYAPLEVRGRCRFHPTCSTYMIMAIQKYGILIGITKGTRRLLRCKPPNGGDDFP